MHNGYLACRQLTQRLGCQLDITKQAELRHLHEPRFTDRLALLTNFEYFSLQANAVTLPLDVHGNVVIARRYQATWLCALASGTCGRGADLVRYTAGWWMCRTDT